MTPRIAFAIAFSLACGAASSDETASQRPDPLLQPPTNRSSPPAESALQIGTDGALPVIELVAPTMLSETIDLTSEPEELYQRLRQGFSMPNINNALVLHHQQWYLNHPESLRRMVERSSRYLHHIVEEIEKRGMPTELALLPMVESAYNPTAYSRSHASGLWQFVPATGRQYKLEQNWWADGRRDIVASTAAALEYLQYIYDLHGDWHLALASYNWGEGAVGRAIGKNAAQGLPTDYLSLKMPEETRQYVPKLQALKNIFSNPNILASLNLSGVPNRPYFATVTKTANIDVKLAAELAEMPVKEFVALNPAHNRPVIKSETPMVIPAHKVDTFISNLEAYEESEKPLSSWQAYTLRPGERLEQIAPRFGMTVANLRAVNGINGRLKVSAGQTLLVAGHEGSEAADLAAQPEILPEQPRVVELQPRIPERQPRLAELRLPQADPTPIAATRMHTTQKGDTLARIAQRYGMSVAELKQINKLRADRVSPGTRLAVAAPEPVSKPAAQRSTLAEAESKPRADVPSSASARTHTVQKGETLARIAQRYGMSVAELKQINKLRADQVNAGTRLALAAPESGKPVASGRITVVELDNRAAARSDPTPAAAARTHTVQKGETLAELAKRYGMSAAELKQINKLRTDQVKPGTRLALAAPEPASKAPASSRNRTDLAELESRPKSVADSRERLARVETKTGKKADAAAEPTRQSARKPAKLAQYTIRRGDTLVSIARQFKVEKDDLLRWNRLQPNDLKAGQTLTIQLVQNTL